MNNKLANRLFIGGLTIFFGGMIIFGVSHHFSKEADMSGDRQAHTDCSVIDKYDKPVARGQAHNRNYFIDSTCGVFRTSQDISNILVIGQNYDWSATVGNWATKPTVISVEPSH